ncbi:CHAT domain-containing protein [Irpex lacteus]|nr:CHAT domain-containing protein [Irpex lacteus]
MDSPHDLSSVEACVLCGGRARQEFLARGDQDALELFVHCYRRALVLTPEDPALLNGLGVALMDRYGCLHNCADLYEAISFFQKANNLTFDDSGHPPKKSCRLGNLARAMFARSQLEENPQDLEEAISVMTYVMSLTCDGCQDKPKILDDLGSFLSAQFQHTRHLDHLTHAIALQSQAVVLTPKDDPDRHRRLHDLSRLLQIRFQLEGDVQDQEQSITLQDWAIRLAPSSHSNKGAHFTTLGAQLLERFERFNNRDDLERAIALLECALELTPNDSPARPTLLHNLSHSLQHWSETNGDVLDLVKALSYQADAFNLTPDDDPDKLLQLHNFGTLLVEGFQASTKPNVEALDAAIFLQCQSLDALPDNHLNRHSWLNSLADSLFIRYNETGDATSLAEAIECGKHAVELSPMEHVLLGSHLKLLGRLYETRMTSCYAQPEDLMHALESYSHAMQHTYSPLDVQRRAACCYTSLLSANISELDNALEIPLLQAYNLQLNLISQCIWLGNDIQDWYTVHKCPNCNLVVAKAAASAIAAGNFIQAVEWIENGRMLVWSHILQLRTPLKNLCQLHPQLGANLGQVSQALQCAAILPSSTTTPHLPWNTSLDIQRSPTNVDVQTKTSHSYAIEYKKLIAQVRELDGFEDFLKSKTLTQLAGACTSGPIAILNVHESQCDCLVLYNAEGVKIKHIPLSSMSLEYATKLCKDLWSVLSARNLRGRLRDSMKSWSEDFDRGANLPGKGAKYDPMFKILADLWTMVTKPVIDFICTLPIVDTSHLPHITWCPIGPFAFLPLHAAGIYHANGAPSETIMNHVISSYTPTLEALLKPRAQVKTAHDTPRVLVVSQPATPGCNPIPETTTEAGIVMSLTGESTQVLDDTDGTVHTVLEAMATHNWVHLACHGMQDKKSPINSSFALHDGKLTLKTLMSKHLPNADLAVLSACQTATGDEDLVEEAVHLAAGMLNIGFKSVIGTMWSIYDDSAPVVMARFYEVMMEQVHAGKELQPAYALHEATKALRETYGVNDFVRWIPFVHFGL